MKHIEPALLAGDSLEVEQEERNLEDGNIAPVDTPPAEERGKVPVSEPDNTDTVQSLPPTAREHLTVCRTTGMRMKWNRKNSSHWQSKELS